MTNQTILIGRLTENPTIKELESGKKVTAITIAVTRNYKNLDGEYESDFIDCVLWNTIAESTTTYCKKGDLIAIKGRVQKSKDEEMVIVAEKVSFLSSRKETNEEEE